VLAIVLGAVLVTAVAQDVFATVLFPASRRGLIRKPMTRWIWRTFRVIGRRAEGQRRRNLLSYGGPVVITATIVTWFVVLIAGWALIYMPGIGTTITATSGGTDESWTTAAYFSGFNLTTLGTGDIAAHSDGYRLLTVAEAGMGFVVISMVITYFLSVYASLTSRNAFAEGLDAATGGTGDPVELIIALAADGHLDLPPKRVRDDAQALRMIHQTHCFYPVLRYFHYRAPYYALPRILLVTLDTAALLETAVDGRRHPAAGSRAVDELGRAARTLLDELLPDRDPEEPARDVAARWRSHYENARRRLATNGVAVTADERSGAIRYCERRAAWDAALERLADVELYQWSRTGPPQRVPTDDG
jgi:hypothetical protein